MAKLQIKDRVSGYLMEALSEKQVGELAKPARAEDRIGQQTAVELGPTFRKTYGVSPDDAWHASRFVVQIRRPLLLRVLGVLLLISATAFSLGIAFTVSRRITLDPLPGILVSVWAAKSILGGQAPKIPTVLVFRFVLFVFQASMVAMKACQKMLKRRRPAGFAARPIAFDKKDRIVTRYNEDVLVRLPSSSTSAFILTAEEPLAMVIV